MSIQKRNRFLDINDSDSEEQDYGSEEEDRGRASLFRSRAPKRQKLQHDSDEEDDDHVSEVEEDDLAIGQESEEEGEEEDEEQEEVQSKLQREDLQGSKDKEPRSKPQRNLPLTRLDDEPISEDELDISSSAALSKQNGKPKSGVIYISRVPPFMKPQVVRNLLSPYGEIGRIFLTPEDSTQRAQRLKSGGNRRKLYTDGWVEFLRKKDAKNVAETLNAQIIGGKKRGRFHDEVWNIKYLRGLKWHHLVEQIANENAERAARMRAEIAQTTRENKMFLENVERAKMLEGMEAKRQKKGVGPVDDEDVVGENGAKQHNQGFRRQFKQNEVKLKKARSGPEKTEEVQRVLSKIF